MYEIPVKEHLELADRRGPWTLKMRIHIVKVSFPTRISFRLNSQYSSVKP